MNCPSPTRAASAIACAVAILSTSTSYAGDTVEFLMSLDGAQQVPHVQTDATGTGTAVLDLDTLEFNWSITFEGLSSQETAAHFHGPAVACENAPPVITLPLGSPKEGSRKLTQDEAEDLLAGRWYVNVHSQNHPPGEIRAQVYPAPLDNPIEERISRGDLIIALEPVADGLTAPNWGASPRPLNGNRDDRLFVTDQNGVLWAIDVETGEKNVFLDVSDRIVDLGIFGENSFDERGLLGVAFHPLYFENGLLYTYESHPADDSPDFSTMPEGSKPNHQTVITEWRVPEPTNRKSVVDPNSAREFLIIDQPQFNHNAGAIVFGPDDMLYIALGDGGGADDKDGQRSLGVEMVGHGCIGNGLDLTNPLGAVLRIDPLGNNSQNGRYGVPADNPFFANKKGFVEEIFAYGFRNPFRFSFDAERGDLILADVGQQDIEEINIVESGGNYGWRHKEGTFFFVFNGNARGYVTDLPLDGPKSIDPIAQYDHDDGIAIVGGFVYRGEASPTLEGRYIFGEFALTFDNDGRLFYIDESQNIREFRIAPNRDFGLSLLGFGEDARGEVYVLANGTGVPFGKTGVVMHVVGASLAELTDVVSAFGDILEGDEKELLESDDQVVVARSNVGSALTEPHVTDVRVFARTDVKAPRLLDVIIESQNDHPGAAAQLQLFNHRTRRFDTVLEYENGPRDSIDIAESIDATDYVDEDGRIVLSIKEVVMAAFTPRGFRAMYDLVEIIVR